MTQLNLVVDADSMIYAAGFVAEKSAKHDVSHAYHALDLLINKIDEDLNADEMDFHLTGALGSSSRTLVYPEYKQNRTAPKPLYYNELVEYMITMYDAIVWNSYEADDICSLAITADPKKVCVSIDKDLRTVPGWHYHWKKRELDLVDDYQAAYNFYYQVLIGDPADNVKGCPGIGQVRARSYLRKCSTEQELWLVTKETYEDTGNGHLLIPTCEVLWLQREGARTFIPPI